MESNRVLIVSDSPDRRNFLAYHINHYGMAPVWYQNIFAAAKAVKNDPFSMIVADLLMPLDTKIHLIKKTSDLYPEMKVMTIGKREYLDKTEILAGCSSVMQLNSIESFPETLWQMMQGENA